jgi:hypothetical protein
MSESGPIEVTMATDPEELLRSIERTREELALTVDTIAGRLDPKLAAKRGIGKLRAGVTGVVDGARVKLHLGSPARPVGFSEPTRPDGFGGESGASVGGADAHPRSKYRTDKALVAAKKKLDSALPAVKKVPAPVIGGGLAALVALAAVLYAANRRDRGRHG